MSSLRSGGAVAIPRQSYGRLPQILEVPNLIEVQLNSFRWFQEKGLKQLFEEISPIKDFTGNDWNSVSSVMNSANPVTSKNAARKT